MATFTPDSLSVAVQMYLFFAWAPGNGYAIEDITVIEGAPDQAVVSGSSGSGGLVVTYLGPGDFTDDDLEIPAGGTFDEVSIIGVGSITGIDREQNFAEIDTNNAWAILFGSDDINGSNQDDWLFTGDGGNDTVFGMGGADTIAMAVVNGAPSHFIDGGAGHDTISVLTNVFIPSANTLDLRFSIVQFIEAIDFFNPGLTVLLNSSQLNATNVSLSSTITGPGVFHIVKNQPGTLDLSALNVASTVSVVVEGTSDADFIFGTGVADLLRAGAGADTVNGNGGTDIFLVSGALAESDAMNGGAGTDTLQVEGGGALTLNGFSAASQAIEVWLGNGQGVFGNAGNNSFDLSGLAAISGLAFIDAGAGDDTIVGSAVADLIRGGAGKDAMTGGGGGDVFDFDAVADIGKKKGQLDLIADYTKGLDRIDLSTIDANGKKKGDKAFKFLKKEGAKFTEKAGQLGFDQKKGNTFVQGDTNGDGKADFRLQLAGQIDLAKGDFVL